jgi:hypothetical protein
VASVQLPPEVFKRSLPRDPIPVAGQRDDPDVLKEASPHRSHDGLLSPRSEVLGAAVRPEGGCERQGKRAGPGSKARGRRRARGPRAVPASPLLLRQMRSSTISPLHDRSKSRSLPVQSPGHGPSGERGAEEDSDGVRVCVER